MKLKTLEEVLRKKKEYEEYEKEEKKKASEQATEKYKEYVSGKYMKGKKIIKKAGKEIGKEKRKKVWAKPKESKVGKQVGTRVRQITQKTLARIKSQAIAQSRYMKQMAIQQQIEANRIAQQQRATYESPTEQVSYEDPQQQVYQEDEYGRESMIQKPNKKKGFSGFVEAWRKWQQGQRERDSGYRSQILGRENEVPEHLLKPLNRSANLLQPLNSPLVREPSNLLASVGGQLVREPTSLLSSRHNKVVRKPGNLLNMSRNKIPKRIKLW